MTATSSGRARVSPTARDEHAAEAQPALPAAARLYEEDGGNDRQGYHRGDNRHGRASDAPSAVCHCGQKPFRFYLNIWRG
jgi:hypothetical protein